MQSAFEKAVEAMDKCKDPAEKAHIKSEIDAMPLSTGQLDQVIEREVLRKEHDIKVYNEAHNR